MDKTRPTTLELGNLRLRPWVLGDRPLVQSLASRIQSQTGLNPLCFEVLEASSLGFYALVNAANAHAFGGLGMPAWVQLDCCTLPSAMIGFAAPREAVDPALTKALEQGTAPLSIEARLAAKRQPWIPVSEYCALIRPDGQLSGCSLFSILKGFRLGLRTKALALLAHDRLYQLGLTQYQNNAVQTHASFGPLEIIRARAYAHTRPEQTFVYRLQVPPPPMLRSVLETGQALALAPGIAPNAAEIIDPHIATRMQKRLDAGQKPKILARTGDQLQLYIDTSGEG